MRRLLQAADAWTLCCLSYVVVQCYSHGVNTSLSNTMCLSDLEPSVAASQVLREAQARIQQAPPPPGSSSPQKDSGMGTTGDATRKEFEVRSLLAATGVAVYAMAMSAPAGLKILMLISESSSFWIRLGTLPEQCTHIVDTTLQCCSHQCAAIHALIWVTTSACTCPLLFQSTMVTMCVYVCVCRTS